MDNFSSSHGQYKRALASWEDAPRGGRTTEFADLFGTEEQQQDYIVGILIVALIISCFFFCWGIFLCILKCIGRGRVGFLAGGPYELTVRVGQKREPNKRPLRGRIIFGVSGILLIVFTLTLIALGLANLEETTSELARGAELGATVFTDTEQILLKFESVIREGQETRDDAVGLIKEYFETGEDKDSNRTTLASAQVAAAKFIYGEENLQEDAARVEDALYSLDGMLEEPAQELKDVMNRGEEKFEGISSGLSGVELHRLQMGYGIPYIVMPSLLLLLMAITAMGVKSAAKDCCVSVCVLPIFVLLVAVLILMTAVFSIGGIVNGDFCSGGASKTPDETLLQIMSYKLDHDHSRLEYRLTEYLVNECEFDDGLNPTDEYPLEFIINFNERLEIALDQIREFGGKLNAVGIPVLQRDLGVNVTQLDLRLEEFREEATEMFDLLNNVVKELACQRLYEVYYQVIHEATCETNYKGLVWTFSSFLVMSFCGCMMITFRAVLYPVVGIDDEFVWNDKNDQEIKEVDPIPNEEVVGGGKYVENDGVDDMGGVPMGGHAPKRYETVGDDNPFEDGNNESFAPKRSVW